MSKKPLTDDDIRRQLKEVRGTLALLSTTLQGLEEQLDEREHAKKLESKPPVVSAGGSAANNAELKDPASKPVVEVKPRGRYGFMLPRGLTGNFNSAKSLVEAMAVPNYVEENVKPQDLADYRTVLAALAAAPAQKANRSVIFLPELMKFIPDELVSETGKDPAMRDAMDTLQGKSRMGMNIAVLKARTPDNKPALLYVIQDTERKSMIVAGPDRISAGLKQQLANGGVEYVVKGDPESVDSINAFVMEGSKQRWRAGHLVSGSTQAISEGLIKAFAALCELPEPMGEAVNHGVTLGYVVHNSKSQPAAFTHILRAGGKVASF